MHSLETIHYLHEQREVERRNEYARKPIKLYPDHNSIRNPKPLDSAWECQIEVERDAHDGYWMSSLFKELNNAAPEQRAWLEQVILETVLLPALVSSGRDALTTRLEITLEKGGENHGSSLRFWETWSVRLCNKECAQPTPPTSQHMLIDYSSGILQPRIHDLEARMLVKQLTDKCGREILTTGSVALCTMPKSVWLLFKPDQREKILESLNLEHASLVDLVAAFFFEPTISANVYRDREKEPHSYKIDGASGNFDDKHDFTMWNVWWFPGKIPELGKCATALGSGSGLQGGRDLLLRKKTTRHSL